MQALLDQIRANPERCERIASQKELYEIAKDILGLKVNKSTSKGDLCKAITRAISSSGAFFSGGYEREEKKEMDEKAPFRAQVKAPKAPSITTLIRKHVLGQDLYDMCAEKGGRVEKAQLAWRLKQLQDEGLFKDCSEEDLARICDFKKEPSSDCTKSLFDNAREVDDSSRFKEFNTCGICYLDEDEKGKLPLRTPCGHMIHGSCLYRASDDGDVNCPFCRKPLIVNKVGEKYNVQEPRHVAPVAHAGPIRAPVFVIPHARAPAQSAPRAVRRAPEWVGDPDEEDSDYEEGVADERFEELLNELDTSGAFMLVDSDETQRVIRAIEHGEVPVPLPDPHTMNAMDLVQILKEGDVADAGVEYFRNLDSIVDWILEVAQNGHLFDGFGAGRMENQVAAALIISAINGLTKTERGREVIEEFVEALREYDGIEEGLVFALRYYANNYVAGNYRGGADGDAVLGFRLTMRAFEDGQVLADRAEQYIHRFPIVDQRIFRDYIADRND